MNSRADSGLTAVEAVAAILLISIAVALLISFYNRRVAPQQAQNWALNNPARVFEILDTSLELKIRSGDSTAPEQSVWFVTVNVKNKSNFSVPLHLDTGFSFFDAGGDEISARRSDVLYAELRYEVATLAAGAIYQVRFSMTEDPQGGKVLYLPKAPLLHFMTNTRAAEIGSRRVGLSFEPLPPASIDYQKREVRPYSYLPEEVLQTVREEPADYFTFTASAERDDEDGPWQVISNLVNQTDYKLPGVDCLKCIYLMEEDDRLTLLPHEFADSWAPDENVNFETLIFRGEYADFNRVANMLPEGARILYAPAPIANEFWQFVTNPPDPDTAEWKRFQALQKRCLVAEVSVADIGD